MLEQHKSEKSLLMSSFIICCLFFSSFKHLIGGLEEVSSKGPEDADAKAK